MNFTIIFKSIWEKLLYILYWDDRYIILFNCAGIQGRSGNKILAERLKFIQATLHLIKSPKTFFYGHRQGNQHYSATYVTPQTEIVWRRVLRESDKRDKKKQNNLYFVAYRNATEQRDHNTSRTHSSHSRIEHCVSTCRIHWPLFVFTRACGRIALYS